MKLLKKLDTIPTFFKRNRADFETIAREYQNMSDNNDIEYDILDYSKILKSIESFVSSFCDYKEENPDDRKYMDKLILSTKNFYNKMFIDKEYRTHITLNQFPEISKQFIELSKNIQVLIDNISKSNDMDTLQMAYMVDSQFNKISRVFKDDMQIYKWLSLSGSKIFSVGIDEDIRKSYLDVNAPVMHKSEKKGLYSK